MNEKVNRIHLDGHEQPRSLGNGIEAIQPAADFCTICGHWTTRPVVAANNKKCCGLCSKRVSELSQ